MCFFLKVATPQAMTMTAECVPPCGVWVCHVHSWILLCLDISSPKPHCHHIAPLHFLAFLHGDTGDSPTRPSMSELFLSLQTGTSFGLFNFKRNRPQQLQLALGSWKCDWQSHGTACSLSLTRWFCCFIQVKNWGEGNTEWVKNTGSEKTVLRAREWPCPPYIEIE